MAIELKDNRFHLYNDEMSYIIEISRQKDLLNIYYGARVDAEEVVTQRKQPGAFYCCADDNDPDYSLSVMGQEYPSAGACDFRLPAYEIKNAKGMHTPELKYKSYEILNGKPVFGRWVLDQGFYPDGIYTAPTDEALKNDILCSMRLGFNGARMHEKIFEPRFLYWADKLGYIVWGEHANWGLDITDMGQIQYFLPEWLEALDRDMCHPSIIGWCPFNETWDFDGRQQYDELIRLVYLATKAVDPTRPVIDTSGNFHVQTDIFDVHDYEQNPERFASYYEKIVDGIIEDQIQRKPEWSYRQSYNGKNPVFVSEYGGIRWAPDKAEGWGYGEAPKTTEEFIERYKGLTEALINNPYMIGFCCTQLYDVEQEVNGLMTYDRKFKFDPEIIRRINTQQAAIEED